MHIGFIEIYPPFFILIQSTVPAKCSVWNRQRTKYHC